MKENILRIHLNGIESNDLEPNVAEMNEILPKVGFRPLTDATPDTLPVGSVVVIYNCKNHTLFSVVVCEYNRDGFSYMPFGQLNTMEPDIMEMRKKYDFKDNLYKVFMKLPVVCSKPQSELLPEAIKEIGFRPLDEATPDDLPEGCVVFLYTDSGAFTPVIVRVLSMSNKRFLYWRQSAKVAGDWESAVIMDNLNPFRNYSYLVVS